MEFVALGVLGVLAIANKPPPEKHGPSNKIVSSKDLETEFKQDVAAHFDNKQVVPFFRSEKSQNTNDALKDRRLGTFTGVNNIDYRPKQETEATPPVKDLTNIHGTTFQPDMQRYQHYMTSGKNHNVSPVEKQYVGPGLGIDPHQAAEGGFHSTFRILPDNVNGYRKNIFGGTVVHGSSAVHKREHSDFENTRCLSKLTDQEMASLGARGLDAPHGAVAGQSARAEQILPGFRNENQNCYPGAAGYAPVGAYQVAEQTRMDDRTNCHVMGGAFRSIDAGYSQATFLTNATERETINDVRTNVAGNQFGTYTQASDDARGTLRGQTNTTEGHLTGNGYYSGSREYEARDTHRQHTLHSYTGNAGFGTGSQLRSQESTLRTMRGQGLDNQGPAGTVIPGASKYESVSQTISKPLVADFTPNTGRNTTNTRLNHTLTQFGCDNNANRICSNPQGLGTQTHSAVQQIGTVFHTPKPIDNNRDFGYVLPNPLRTDITRKQ